ncbi:MAG: primosomal protein N' [Phycisphaerales bacterium]|nr:MAG: primosomal protein N' [Phycisphaerales bacterium]
MTRTSLFQSDASADQAGRYVLVAIERGVERGSRRPGTREDAPEASLVYADPLGLRVGEGVSVPLRGASVPGVVVQIGGPELLGGVPEDVVRAVESRSGGTLPTRLVELGEWISRYYVCPLGMVFATMRPSAVKKGVGRESQTMLSRGEAPDLDSLTPLSKKTWSAIADLDEAEFPIEESALVVRLGLKSPRSVRALLAAGALHAEHRHRVRARGRFTTLIDSVASETRSTGHALTPSQSGVVEGISKTLGTFATHLLFGVTGSGKTEVYLRLLELTLMNEKASDDGRGERPAPGAIVLVPEIALTPQTADRFISRFGSENVAVLHSGLSASERHAEWDRLARGEARIAIGPRSAVFAPLDRVRLIIVDEEHDHSYKQDQLPRYHGRDVAIKRAQLEGCPIVLGSATPSLESWHNAQRLAHEGHRSRLWRLSERVAGGRLPAVRIVDRAEERRHPGASDRDLIGPTLRSAIERTLKAQGQIILLHNRRGLNAYLACPRAACGHVVGCEHCDSRLVLHADAALRLGGVVRCHYCHAETRVPKQCPQCDATLRRLAPGTQHLEQEIEATFGDHGIRAGETLWRVDSDSMRSAADYFQVLGKFSKGEIRILAGTQMIAKGLDVANVRLVGVLDADVALNLPDFRASERSFQLIAQVAGRAGRGEHEGHVIVQTFDPTNRAIVRAAAHDFEGFAADELKDRALFGLPPMARMARVVCRDQDESVARTRAKDLAEAIASVSGDRVTVEGPMPCEIARIAGFHRWELRLIARSAGTIQQALADARRRGWLKSDHATAVDVDPVSLM